MTEPNGMGAFGAAARATALLEPAAQSRIERFVIGQLTPEGGFRGRTEAADLYFTLFGLATLRALALDVPAEPVRRYLAAFDDSEGLDPVHLCSLILCHALLAPGTAPTIQTVNALDRLTAYRCADGGFAPGATGGGTVYASYLAVLAHASVPALLPAGEQLAEFVRRLEMADGGFANAPGTPVTTTVTAAAVGILRRLGAPTSPATTAWLRARHCRLGGFVAHAQAPVPDLLSTATALYALWSQGEDLSALRPACLQFVEALWQESGGFTGTLAEHEVDCEYTFYGLLALGCLA